MEASMKVNGETIKRTAKVTHSFKFVGTFYFATANRYVGEWKDNKMHGKGKLLICF
jgi:hypothetical protein